VSASRIPICRTYSRRVAEAVHQTLADMHLDPEIVPIAFGYAVRLPDLPDDSEAVVAHLRQCASLHSLCECCLRATGYTPPGMETACAAFEYAARVRQRDRKEAPCPV